GVDDRYVATIDGTQTPVVFCEIFPPDDFPIYFYRRPKAPDQCLTEEHLDRDALRRARIVWISGSCLAVDATRSATLAGGGGREAGAGTGGLDWWPRCWSASDGAPALYARALERATVAVGSRDEVEVAVGARDPDRGADLLLARGVWLAVVKQ